MTSDSPLWEDRYKATINNSSRNFSIKEDNNYEICNIFCNFEISDLENKKGANKIKGITVSTSQNILHLDPTVDIGTSSSKPRDYLTNSILKYNFNLDGSGYNTYYISDVFIRAPSKIVIFGKRYAMEACLVFKSSDGKQFVIVSTPMVKSTSCLDPTDLTKVELHNFLSKIADKFPEKYSTASIKDVEWDPKIFIPVNTENNRSYATWIDKNSNGKIAYIQYFRKGGFLEIPCDFYDKFINNLVDGPDMMNTEQSQIASEDADVDIKLNLNEAPRNILTQYSVKAFTVPPIPNYYTEVKEEPPKKEDKEDSSFQWATSIAIWVIVALLVLSIIFIMYELLIVKKRVYSFTDKVKNFFKGNEPQKIAIELTEQLQKTATPEVLTKIANTVTDSATKIATATTESLKPSTQLTL